MSSRTRGRHSSPEKISYNVGIRLTCFKDLSSTSASHSRKAPSFDPLTTRSDCGRQPSALIHRGMPEGPCPCAADITVAGFFFIANQRARFPSSPPVTYQSSFIILKVIHVDIRNMLVIDPLGLCMRVVHEKSLAATVYTLNPCFVLTSRSRYCLLLLV